MLAVAINLLNPAAVVIGGDMAAAFDFYVAGVRESVYRRSAPLATRDLQFLPPRTATGPASSAARRSRSTTCSARWRSTPGSPPPTCLGWPVEPNTWLWILAGFLAAIFVGTGLLKLTTPRERLVEAGIGWTGTSPGDDPAARLAELLGASAWSSRAARRRPGPRPDQRPLPGALMLGATVVHVRRGELLPDALRALALVVCCVVLAVYRFGPQAF